MFLIFFYLKVNAYCFSSSSVLAQKNPQCINNISDIEDDQVHVWFNLINSDPVYNWYIQFSLLYENNIRFINENCKQIKINKVYSIEKLKGMKVGLIIKKEKFFQSIYAITAVRNSDEIRKVPDNKVACVFVISAYAPGQFNRMDWKMNNADCYTTNYGTDIYLK